MANLKCAETKGHLGCRQDNGWHADRSLLFHLPNSPAGHIFL